MSHVKSVTISKDAARRIGVVETDSRDRTRKVVVNSLKKHRKYGKYVRRRTVLHVHDENNESRKGDRVEIAECRPISKTKSWMLVRVVEQAAVLDDAVSFTARNLAAEEAATETLAEERDEGGDET